MRKIIASLLLLNLAFNLQACGCGIALAPASVFNNLKEANAYLIVDTQADGSFHLKPYFRFVSLDQKQNVTLVFPLKSLPKSFDTQLLTQSEFLDQQGITTFNQIQPQQSPQGTYRQISSNALGPAFLYSFGFAGSAALVLLAAPYFLLNVLGGVGAMAGARGPLQHFDFPGGSLDIYNASSANTLGELTAKMGFNAQGGLADMVKKYQNYYVAVLNLQVNTPLPDEQMTQFKNECTTEYLDAKDKLNRTGTVPLTTGYDRCATLENKFIQNAAGTQDYPGNSGIETEPKGVLLDMGFNPNDTIFYPVSVVESYNYPVGQQQYFIKVPTTKEFQFNTSYASQTALIDTQRWYEVQNTHADLEGHITPVTLPTQADDAIHQFWAQLYPWAWLIPAIIYIACGLMIWKTGKKKDWKNATAFFILGGAIWAAYKLRDQKRETLLLLLGIVLWFALALIKI